MADLRPLGDGWYLIADGDRRWRVAIASDREATWVFVDGQVARIEAGFAPSRGRVKGRGDAGVMAPMPATVIAINTAPGQTVNQGDTLIVLEAMKMELPIKSPLSGTVMAVRCAKGELVQPNVNLIEIE